MSRIFPRPSVLIVSCVSTGITDVRSLLLCLSLRQPLTWLAPFCTDQLGENSQWGKVTDFESATRIPFMVRHS